MIVQRRPAAALLILTCAGLVVCETRLQNFVGKVIAEPFYNFTAFEEEIVAMINTDSEHMTDDMRATVERTVKMLDNEVVGKIIKSHKADKQTLKSLKDNFEMCEEDRKSTTYKIERMEHKFGKTHRKLVKCRTTRDGEADRHKHYVECKDVEKGLKHEMEQQCEESAAEIARFQGLAGDCKSHGKMGYANFVTWNEEAFENQIEKHDKELAECDTATTAYKNKVRLCAQKYMVWQHKKGTCKQEQGYIELNSCKRLDITLGLNRRYARCYTPVLSSYQRLIPKLKQAQKERNEEWSAVARIKCFLKVFTIKGNKEKTDQIENCRQKTFGTNEYNLFYWPAPHKKARKEIMPYACTDKYVALHYTNRFDDKWAPKTKCRWCSAHKPTPPPTPEPTPMPTPFPTPPPTTAPTPSPTKAEGQGCWIEIFTKKRFKGASLNIRYKKKSSQRYITDKIIQRGGLVSWKAGGSQCKFCFYAKSGFFGQLLGSRIAPKKGASSAPSLIRTKSIKIIDKRFATRCPRTQSGKGEDK